MMFPKRMFHFIQFKMISAERVVSGGRLKIRLNGVDQIVEYTQPFERNFH